jgi:gluconolactonase
MALSPNGELREVAAGFTYCNGIGVEPSGALVVVERKGLMRLGPDGGREWLIESLGPGAGDGFCLDVEGTFYVAVPAAHGVLVVSPEGRVLDRLEADDGAVLTNCCFGGPDMRTLFATEMTPGGVIAWDRTPVSGAPLSRFPA